MQDLEKLTYIIRKIKNNNSITNANKKQEHQRLLETLPTISKELNTIKVEQKNLKSFMEVELKNYFGNSYIIYFHIKLITNYT